MPVVHGDKIDKKKIITINFWCDYGNEQEVFYLKKQIDVNKVRDFIKELRELYWEDFNQYTAIEQIKEYIIEKLNWSYIHDFWRIFNLK